LKLFIFIFLEKKKESKYFILFNENVLEIEFWRVKEEKKNRKVKMWS